MIQSLKICNYRSCLETSILLQPDLSVLIGPNGSGKTNLLHAVFLLKKLADKRPDFMRRESQVQAGGQSQIRARFRLDGKHAVLSADIHLDTDDNNEDVIRESKQSWFARDFTQSRARIGAPLGLGTLLRDPNIYHPVLVDIRRGVPYSFAVPQNFPETFLKPFISISEYLSNVRYYSASRFTDPSRCPVSFQIEKEGTLSRGKSLKGHAKFLFDLYSEFRTREGSRYKQFFEVIGPNGIALVQRINFKEIPTSSIDYTVQSGGRIRKKKREKILIIPQFTVGRNELSPNQLSEGTFKTITLLFYLMTEKSSALLIEEPEVCVHHGLLSSIIELIKTYSKQKQIILSTHSDFVLDKMDVRHVYKVARDNKAGTTVTHLFGAMSRDDLAALKNYLDNEGNLGEYWKHGGLEEDN